jgi:hypothetical protein
MFITKALTCWCCGQLLTVLLVQAETENFDKMEAGSGPPQWLASQTGKGTAHWMTATFPRAGAVGVWTKADSVTLFDDFRSGPLTVRRH